MSKLVHPNEALFKGEKPFPVIPSCEHFAGSEKLIVKALELQDKLGPIFDISCDCEDGAQAGKEKEHAEMIVRVLGSPANKYKQAGVRIHDYTHAHWKKDIDILVGGAGNVLAYITIPKPTNAAQVAEMIAHVQQTAARHGVKREIPIHVLVETHGALAQAQAIAALPWLQVLDFGLMDFVSGHHGAVPASAMRSPGQFEHKLLARAKTEIVAAALAHGIVPAHNVTLDLKNTYATYQDAFRARHEFGFLRMWSIYPAQIQPIVDAMKPDYSEVEDAANILLSAQKSEWGPIQYQGELHDRAT
jgi:citrate lyase subunit beta/citryl-CoA lyase